MTTNRERIHFIGIGGAGLSAIARVLLEQGRAVSGSDAVLSPAALALRQSGAEVYEGHRPEHVAGATTVVASSAIREDNPEVVAARSQGIPVLKRSEFLGQLLADRTVIAVAGTHGKTTTTSMVAYILDQVGLQPGFIIGGQASNFGTNARAGHGPLFVIEADEYDRMFLGLQPQVAVVTNIDMDHPDCYPVYEDLYQAFWQFSLRTRPGGLLVMGFDNPGSRRMYRSIAAEPSPVRRISYGFTPGADVLIRQVTPNHRGGVQFEVVPPPSIPAGGEQPPEPGVQGDLLLAGDHNASNAVAAALAASPFGLTLSQAMAALATFRGAGRRFEVRGEVGGVTVVDDYAHHPAEIRATLNTARQRYGQRAVWAVWQPHTFSRVQALESGFLQAFDQADHVLITDIYASREAFNPAVRSVDLVAKMAHSDARYTGPLPQAAEVLAREVQSGDVVVTLSAGDGNLVGEWLLHRLQSKATDPQLTRNAAS